MSCQAIKERLLTILLILLPISSSLCIDMYLPAYGDLAIDFGVREGAINLSMGIYLFGLAIGQLIYGPFADRFGRRKTLLSGLSIFVVASLLCTTTTTLPLFILFRLFQALGACSTLILSRTIVTDIYHPEKRTSILALIAAVNVISPALAPFFGGILLKWANWHFIFITIAAFGLLLTFGMTLLLKETLIEPDREALKPMHMLYNLKRLFQNRVYSGYLLCISAVYAMIFTWISYSPSILMHHFNIPPNQFGLYFLLPAIGNTLGALFTAKFSSKFSNTQHLIGFGLLLIAVAILSLFLVNLTPLKSSPFGVLSGIVLAFFGTGIILPLLISNALSQFIDIAGFSSGILGFFRTISGSATSFISGKFYGNNQLFPVMMAIAISIALLAFFIRSYRWKTRALTVVAEEESRKPTNRFSFIRYLNIISLFREKLRVHKGKREQEKNNNA